MDQCRYCQKYHNPTGVCDSFIEALKNGEVPMSKEEYENSINSREFWLFKDGTGCAEPDYQALKPDDALADEFIHVIEYSAYEKLSKLLEKVSEKAVNPPVIVRYQNIGDYPEGKIKHLNSYHKKMVNMNLIQRIKWAIGNAK